MWAMGFMAFSPTISPFLVEYKAPFWWNIGLFLWSIGLSNISPKEPYIHKKRLFPTTKALYSCQKAPYSASYQSHSEVPPDPILCVYILSKAVCDIYMVEFVTLVTFQ